MTCFSVTEEKKAEGGYMWDTGGKGEIQTDIPSCHISLLCITARSACQVMKDPYGMAA